MALPRKLVEIELHIIEFVLVGVLTTTMIVLASLIDRTHIGVLLDIMLRGGIILMIVGIILDTLVIKHDSRCGLLVQANSRILSEER